MLGSLVPWERQPSSGVHLPPSSGYEAIPALAPKPPPSAPLTLPSLIPTQPRPPSFLFLEHPKHPLTGLCICHSRCPECSPSISLHGSLCLTLKSQPEDGLLGEASPDCTGFSHCPHYHLVFFPSWHPSLSETIFCIYILSFCLVASSVLGEQAPCLVLFASDLRA